MNTPQKVLGLINRTHRTSRSMDLLTPRRSPNNALFLHMQKQCTAKRVLSGVFHPCLWPLKAP